VRVGLTGGIASGKSTVSTMLRELGAVVIDADRLAREVVAKGTEGFDEVVAAFGSEVVGPDGELDRPALGAIVFSDEAKRRQLEAIIHPRVRDASAALEADVPPGALVVHDIPLLAEAGRGSGFDAVIVVDASEEDAITRMIRDRAMSREEALSRIRAQATREQRRAIATYVLTNDKTVADLREQVATVFAELSSV
jgi:dephospho-CoA kinase